MSVIEGILPVIAVASLARDLVLRHQRSSLAFPTYLNTVHYLETSGLTRSSLFITTKVSFSLGNVAKAISDSLNRLRLDYVDLYLIHSPFTEHDIVEAWRKMERLVDEGKARAIGVSNFRISDFEKLLPHCRIRPVVNQIEHHPHLLQHDLIDYCRSHQITIESYGPLAPIAYIRDGPSPLKPVLGRLASKYGKSEAQILIRRSVQRGHIRLRQPLRLIGSRQTRKSSISNSLKRN